MESLYLKDLEWIDLKKYFLKNSKKGFFKEFWPSFLDKKGWFWVKKEGHFGPQKGLFFCCFAVIFSRMFGETLSMNFNIKDGCDIDQTIQNGSILWCWNDLFNSIL